METGATILATAFDGYEVTHLFHVPSILCHTLRELEARPQISRVVAHSEKASAYMADGYARASGRPGVCFAQMVGAVNLASGLRDAHLAGSPVIALTGGPTAAGRHRNTYQDNEDFPIFRGLTKSSVRVDTVDRLPDSIRQAFRTATTGAPGPVHLELPGHLGEVLEVQETAERMEVEPQFARACPFRPAADPEMVAAAARLIARAAKPILVVGGGVRASRAQRDLVTFAEQLGLPVATSLTAKDSLPGLHPLNMGVPGLYSRPSANVLVREADLVVFVGSGTGSQVTHSWTVPERDVDVIQVDIDPEELGRNYPNKVSLNGDARTVIRQLVAASGELVQADRAAWLARVTECVRSWRKANAGVLTADVQPIRPERICGVLSEHLPDDALIVSDTGHSGMWTAAFLDLSSGQGFLRAAGSLGWGFPAAIGAQLGAPDRPVVLFTGDGGLYYHIAEIETAVRWNVPLVAVVNNNRALNQEIGLYTEIYGGELYGRHEELWRFQDIDLAGVAESLGARGIRVTKAADLPVALHQALESGRPTIIDVVTDDLALAPPASLE